MRNTHTFSATPTPAEAVTPKVFTMVWITRKEVPTSSSLQGHRQAQPQLQRDDAPVKADAPPGEVEGQPVLPALDDRQETTTLTAWAATVARAAPAAPR